jgi:hypothetical protein
MQHETAPDILNDMELQRHLVACPNLPLVDLGDMDPACSALSPLPQILFGVSRSIKMSLTS